MFSAVEATLTNYTQKELLYLLLLCMIPAGH